MFGTKSRLLALEAELEDLKRAALTRAVLGSGVLTGQVYRLCSLQGADHGLWLRGHADEECVVLVPGPAVGDDYAGRRTFVGFARQCLNWRVSRYADSPAEAFAKLAAEEASEVAERKAAAERRQADLAELFRPLYAPSKPRKKGRK